REGEDFLQHAGHAVGSIAGPHAAELDRLFCSFPLFEVGDAARLGQSTSTGILHRHAEPLELASVELNARSSQDLVQNLKTVKVTDRKAVRFCNPIEIIGGHNSSSARHIFHDDRRITGNMSAHVTRNRPGIGIESAAGGKTHDDTDRLPLKGWLRPVERAAKKSQ